MAYIPRYRPRFIRRYKPKYISRYRPSFIPRYKPNYVPRYRPRFRKLFQSRWEALIKKRRQQRGAYTPEELKWLAEIEKRKHKSVDQISKIEPQVSNMESSLKHRRNKSLNQARKKARASKTT